jgi:hypothetical protein
LGVIATLVVMPLVAWLYLRLGYANLRADAGPSWFESTLAVTALEASAARHAPKQDNPIQPTEHSGKAKHIVNEANRRASVRSPCISVCARRWTRSSSVRQRAAH